MSGSGMGSAASLLAWRLTRPGFNQSVNHNGPGIVIKYGDDIFGDGPYPRDLTQFVGQDLAKDQIMTAMLSAAKRGAPLDHMLLQSGFPGIGKTALAKIVASSLKRGYAEVGGLITAKDIRPTLAAMHDGDVLFIDEIHRMVSSGKRYAEWLLQLLQDGVLALSTGVIEVPRITVIAATTDAQKLPETILSRFPLQPVLEPYTELEAVLIARSTATRMEVELTDDEFARIATASDRNPRLISRLLTTVRDLKLACHSSEVIETAIQWCGQTPDGLSQEALDYLMLLYGYGGKTSLNTMKAALNSIALGHTEKSLIQRGYMTITSQGRELSTLGFHRAQQALADNAPPQED